jgi:hypothetical protein
VGTIESKETKKIKEGNEWEKSITLEV